MKLILGLTLGVISLQVMPDGEWIQEIAAYALACFAGMLIGDATQ